MAHEPQLGFEVDREVEQLSIHGDPDGLRRLAKQLERLASAVEASGEMDHLHLFSEQWGDGEISSAARDTACHPIHHVKFYVWPKENARERGGVA